MRTLASLALLLASVILPARPGPGARPRAEQAVLTPGDSVRIVVWRKPEFSGDFVIAPDGTITHPLFRAVKVAGVPFATAEANLRRFLSRIRGKPAVRHGAADPGRRLGRGDPARSVRLAPRDHHRRGDSSSWRRHRYRSASNRVRVLRLQPNGQQEQVIVEPGEPGSTDGTLPVRSGDQIVIDRKKSFFKDILIPALTIIGSVASVGPPDRSRPPEELVLMPPTEPEPTVCSPAASSRRYGRSRPPRPRTPFRSARS